MRWLRRRSELDFADEIESHIAHEADRLIRSGMRPAEARAAALRSFGDVGAARLQYGERRGEQRFEALVRDVRMAFRTLGREPLFAIAAVATLAVGIGLNTAVFGVIYGLLLRPLPLPEPGQLVAIEQTYRGSELRSALSDVSQLSWEEYEAIRDGQRTLQGVAAFAPMPLTLSAGDPVRASGLMVTCNYFDVLQSRLAMGRTFASDECAARGEAAVVVLSHGFWRRQFASDPGVLGRAVELNRHSFTVIGVAAEGFGGTTLHSPDVWFLLTMQPRFSNDLLSVRGMSWLSVVGRMRPRVEPDDVAADLTRIVRQGDVADLSTVQVEREALMQLGSYKLYAVAGVMALPLLLLAMSCLNVMNLMLARVPVRRRAVRIQLSLGASRRRVAVQLLTESVVLSLIGGAAGFLLARATPSLILAALPFPGGQLDLTPDPRIFAFAVTLPLIAAVLFGVAPALDATRVGLASAHRGDAPGSGGPRSARLRGIIMGTQLAGSLMTLVLTGLFVRALMYARSVDLGYVTQNVYAFRPDLARQGYNLARGAAFYAQFADRVSRLPAVEGTALASQLPLGGHSSGSFHRAESTDTLPPFEQAWSVTVSAEYFQLMAIPIVRGRVFTQDEVRTSDVRPAVISETMAAQFWPGEDPLGRRFRIARQHDHIVTGVARDVRNFSIEDRRRPFFYAAARLDASASADTSSAPPNLSLIVRTNGNAAAASAILSVARALDTAVLVEAESVEGRLAALTEQTRTAGLFAGLFGIFATLLAIIGVYGGIAYAASQRTREIGVRIALGATRTDIVALMMGQGSRPLTVGLAAGALLAAAAAQLTRSLLFGINPLDPVAFLANALLLGGFALLAMYRPARRAAQLDPAQTLRID